MTAKKPTCPECDEDDDYTIELVYSAGGQFTSAHSPWDEAGTAHRNTNTKTVDYFKCSNGHRWREES